MSAACHSASAASWAASSRLLREHNATLDDVGVRRRPRVISPSGHRKWPPLCTSAAVAPAAASSAWPRCSDGREQVQAAGIRVLVGVQSDPRMPSARWNSRHVEAGGPRDWYLGVLRPRPRRSSAKQVRQIDAEDAVHSDILWLPNVTDGCAGRAMSMDKLLGWWRAAWRLLGPTTTHAVKVDDDTHLMLPRLAADLRALHCVQNLYYGPMAFISVNPRTLGTCGFDYGSIGNYRKYGCAQRGFHVAAPFAIGAFIALSPSLVQFVASNPAVDAFVARYAARLTNATKVLLEDMALGFWLAQAERNLTYANVFRWMGDVNCDRPNAGLRRGAQLSIALHRAKFRRAHVLVVANAAQRDAHGSQLYSSNARNPQEGSCSLRWWVSWLGADRGAAR